MLNGGSSMALGWDGESSALQAETTGAWWLQAEMKRRLRSQAGREGTWWLQAGTEGAQRLWVGTEDAWELQAGMSSEAPG